MHSSRTPSLRIPLGATALTTLALVALGLAPVHAQELVTDGTFEAATPTTLGYTLGQSLGDNAFTVASGVVGVDSTTNTNGNSRYVFAGNQSLFLTLDSNVDGVQQTLATTPGQTYTISFAANSDDPNNFFEILFGGRPPAGNPFSITANGYPNTGANSNAGQFTTYSLTATATSSSTVLTILGQSTGTTEVDNVSVRAAPVPEVSTVASFGLLLALGGLTVAAKRRKAAASL